MFFSIITLAAEEKEGLPKAPVPGGGIPRNRENQYLPGITLMMVNRIPPRPSATAPDQ